MVSAYCKFEAVAIELKERQRLDACHRRGKELAAQNEVDYAHEMFVECVLGDPANLLYLESLLVNLRTKHGGHARKGLRFFGGATRRRLKAAVAAHDLPQILRLGLEALHRNPWDVFTLHILADTCAAQHFNEVELAFLKLALDAAPRDANVNRHCARSLARMGQFDQAIACWHRVEELTKGNHEAAKMISRLTVEKMKYPAGKPPVVSKKSAQANETTKEYGQDEEAGHNVRCPPDIKLTPRQLLERAIQDDPADVANYLKLVQLFCGAKQFENAERTLMIALGQCAQRYRIEETLRQVRANRRAFEQEAAEADRKKMLQAERKPLRFPWLESLLVVACMALVFQLMPSRWEWLSNVLIGHLQMAFILCNVFVLGILIFWRQWTR